jgi:flagellar hook-basal body complex protein FliE
MGTIAGVQPPPPHIPQTQQRSQVAIGAEGPSAFQQFLDAAIDVLHETNERQIESDIAQVDFATGRNTDMLTVILAQERANSAMNFTVQVSNRIVEAYREIMRMQI